MGNRFNIFVVFAIVVQSGFASSVVKGIEASSDIEVAHEKANDEFIQAIEILFDSIEGNASIDDAKNGYIENFLKGANNYFAVLPSYYHDDAVQHHFESSFESVVVTLFEAIDLAKSKNGTYPETMTEINAIHAAINVEPIVTDFLDLVGSSSIALRVKILADLDALYRNVFGAIKSRSALNFGVIDEIPSSFKAGAIAAVKAINEDLYDSLEDNTNHA